VWNITSGGRAANITRRDLIYVSDRQVRLLHNYKLLVILYIGIAAIAYLCQAVFEVAIPYAFWGSYLVVLEAWLAATSVVYARSSSAPLQARLSYAFFGAAFVQYLAGDCYWVLTLHTTGIRPHPTSFYDYSRIGFDFCTIAGFALQLKYIFVRQRALAFVDALLVSASLILIVWELGYGTIINNSALSGSYQMSILGLASSDVVVLTLAGIIVLSAFKQGKLAIKVLILAVSAALLMVGDLSTGIMMLNRTYYEGSLPDIVSVVALLLAGYSSALYDHDRSFVTPKPVSANVSLFCHFLRRIPSMMAFTVLILTLGADFLTSSSVSPSALGISLTLIGLIGIRQVLAVIAEHYGQNEELQEVKKMLELDVQQKTVQLREMLELSYCVNETLDISQILCRALDHARKVVRCTDGAARYYDSCPMTGTCEQAMWSDGKAAAVSLDFAIFGDLYCHAAEPGAEAFGKGEGFHVISVQIAVGESQVGWIALGRSDLPFDDADIDLLNGVGQIAIPALANANTYRLAKDASERDPTTNLLNHRAIHEKLSIYIARAQQNNKPLSLIMIDVNNFQRYNATYGHTEGDELLKTVAGTIQNMVPRGSLVGRFGADEFVIGLLGCNTDSALAVASDISRSLESQCIQLSDDDRRIPIAVTCGIASYPDDCDTYEELLLTAEQNLDKARLVGQDIAMTSDVCKVGRQMRSESSFEILDMLVTAVDNKDSYTRKHSEQVAEFATWLCEAIDLGPECTRVIQQAALLHDIGKIGVPAEILGKPGRLTEDEVATINKHSALGASLVAAFKDMEAILPGVKHHHERWDGTGYPDKLAGNEIPLMARILCIADTFSAMVTDRAYRKALSWDIAIEELKSHIGTQFDPELGYIFAKVAKRKLAAYMPRLKRAA